MESELPIPRGTPLFQISQDDLCELERILPIWGDRVAMVPDCPNEIRVQFRVVQRIIQSVRWNYGPWGEVTIIPAGGGQ